MGKIGARLEVKVVSFSFLLEFGLVLSQCLRLYLGVLHIDLTFHL